MTTKTGVDALLSPEESVLALIDHQPFQFANLHRHAPTMIVNNVIGLATTAKAFGAPTILTTVLEQRAAISSRACRMPPGRTDGAEPRSSPQRAPIGDLQ